MGRRANGGAVLLYTVLQFIQLQLITTLNVTELPQGLLQRKFDLTITTELWKVFITIETWSTQWDEIMPVVTALTDSDQSQMDDWSRSQLHDLRDRICNLRSSHQRRQKRGLVDGIGQIAHSLFGLATDREIADLREKIEENRKWQRTISTWSDDLIVVINKTRKEVSENRHVLTEITQRTLKDINNIQFIFTLQ